MKDTPFALFKKIKKTVFHLLDKNAIEANRSQEILNFVRENLIEMIDRKSSLQFSKKLKEKFPELAGIEKGILMEDAEAEDEEIQRIFDKVIESGNIELLDSIIKCIKQAEKDGKNELGELRKNFPKAEFDKT